MEAAPLASDHSAHAELWASLVLQLSLLAFDWQLTTALTWTGAACQRKMMHLLDLHREYLYRFHLHRSSSNPHNSIVHRAVCKLRLKYTAHRR